MPKLLPSRTKYRKVHKGRVRGVASRGNSVSFGEFGIQSLSRGRMTSNQIEAARVAINRHLKRKGKVWIRVFPHKPVTKKPAETRQGKGKGPVGFPAQPFGKGSGSRPASDPGTGSMASQWNMVNPMMAQSGMYGKGSAAPSPMSHTTYHSLQSCSHDNH